MEPIIISIEDSLDLHPFRPEEIPDLLDNYLKLAEEKGFPMVRLIHGKGSGQLREKVHSCLRKNARVSHFRLADPAAGGWGASFVYLKGRQEG
ncbi:Smr/MutS family protein [Desulfococcaceae bacterium OttesenSCG-928-F15]|nr:Smr/MutS family protein [Desulfococcaceae bacterium OttesenSCG-928-F15]